MLFQCHQADAGSTERRICAGWAGCHSGHLLGLQVALVDGRIDQATFEAAATYTSPIELFASGGEAADHGQAGIDRPGPEASRMIEKITRIRGDLRLRGKAVCEQETRVHRPPCSPGPSGNCVVGLRCISS
ncbi:DUF6283 family protein [Streptomyces sp. NPDC004237]|uniref:DUF6283 family protein n=1 Tax=Streptomyces sp. NPDC004237 TaxID=3154455 RepID=UPI0033ABCE3B